MVIGVFNPVGEVAPSDAVLTTTLPDLMGKSVGFVCNNHPAITELWLQLEKNIERDLRPSLVRRIAKENISMPQPQAQLARLAGDIDYALVGVGA